MPKLIRITTIPLSLKLLLSGQMKAAKDNGWEVLMVSADGKGIGELVKSENTPHLIIPFTRHITPLWDLYCLWLLFRLFRREKPDIVHSHTPKAGLLGMIAAKFAGIKVRIYTVAGLPYMVAEKSKKKILIKAEKWTYKCASHVWPNAHSLKDFILAQKLIHENKLEILGSGSSNGVDLELYDRFLLKENHLVAATVRVMPEKNEFIILAVGRLVKDKGIEDLVKAFLDSKIANKARLVLLGSYEQELNPLGDQILRQIQDHPRITQIAWTDHVASYMAISDVLVHASHREGFPNVLLEAGAMQLPIICSDIIGNIDVITDRKTGLLFPVKKVEVLKEALEFAFIKREYMQHLAGNLHKEIVSKYDRKLMHALILKKYNKLVFDS